LRIELSRNKLDLPVYWGNRNWDPLLPETVQRMTADGVKRALAIFTSAYSSYSGCRQYRENLADAVEQCGNASPVIERIGPYFNLPGFVEAFVASTIEAVLELPEFDRQSAHLVFTTHSIPVAMADSSGVPAGAYVRQHNEVAALVAAGVEEATGQRHSWSLAYQSRSGPPAVPWLEPDISDRLAQLNSEGTVAVVAVPIGFVSDHMEVIWDLDVEAAQAASELGMSWVRARTPGVVAGFVEGLVQLVVERLDDLPLPDRERVGDLGPSPDRCLSGCCPNLRASRPAVAGSD
jgi:protoporphyrin/coproporphyrin ferrochelatase